MINNFLFKNNNQRVVEPYLYEYMQEPTEDNNKDILQTNKYVACKDVLSGDYLLMSKRNIMRCCADLNNMPNKMPNNDMPNPKMPKQEQREFNNETDFPNFMPEDNPMNIPSRPMPETSSVKSLSIDLSGHLTEDSKPSNVPKKPLETKNVEENEMEEENKQSEEKCENTKPKFSDSILDKKTSILNVYDIPMPNDFNANPGGLDMDLTNITMRQLERALVYGFEGLILMPNQTDPFRRQTVNQVRATYFHMLNVIDAYMALQKTAPNESDKKIISNLTTQMKMLNAGMLNIYRQLTNNSTTPVRYHMPPTMPVGYCNGLTVAYERLDVVQKDLFRLMRMIYINNIDRQLRIMSHVVSNQMMTVNQLRFNCRKQF